MSNKTLSDVRDHLFTALEGLSNKESPMDIERAKAIGDVAQVLINSAKVEVDMIKATGHGNGSGFVVPSGGAAVGLPPSRDISMAGQLGVTVTRHRLVG